MKIVILAGGKGARLWPLSKPDFPKQFLSLAGSESLLQKTARRFLKAFSPEDLLFVTQNEYLHLVKKQLALIDPKLKERILLEPQRKNTAPAIALALHHMLVNGEIDEQEAFLVAPSDHLIDPEEEFLELLPKAEALAKQGHYVTFGIPPHGPETGYGYLRTLPTDDPQIKKVERFVEKPTRERAQQLLLSGNALWNGGIFVFQAKKLLEDFATFQPAIADGFAENFASFASLPDVSIDYAVMEQVDSVYSLRLTASWSDVGSWDSLYDHLPKTEQNNTASGQVHFVDTKGCLAISKKRPIAAIGLEDLLIVEGEEAILIAKKGHSQKVKALVEQFPQDAASVLSSHRPWGSFHVLAESAHYKVKKICVDPGQKLSLQRHKHRSEHWVVVSGEATITVDETVSTLSENQSIYVPKKAMHRLENKTEEPLEIIEVQVGEYVGEDDIERFDDIYGRASAAESTL